MVNHLFMSYKPQSNFTLILTTTLRTVMGWPEAQAGRWMSSGKNTLKQPGRASMKHSDSTF